MTQIRQNTNRLRKETTTTVNEPEVTLLRDFRDGFDPICAYVNASHDWDSVIPQQQVRDHVHLITWNRNSELSYNLWRSNFLIESICRTREDIIVSIISTLPSRK